jgi:hypothetical protein
MPEIVDFADYMSDLAWNAERVRLRQLRSTVLDHLVPEMEKLAGSGGLCRLGVGQRHTRCGALEAAD